MSTPALGRLLIVDDEKAQMRALCHTLDTEGYSTTGYSSAREALAALRAGAFELLLTDLMMPEMDGISLLNAARHSIGHAHGSPAVPISRRNRRRTCLRLLRPAGAGARGSRS